MWKRVFPAFILLLMFTCWGVAQGVGKKDARGVVEAVGRTIGSPGLKSIEYSANGYYYHFLQGYLIPSPTNPGPWPQFYAKYHRVVDYEKGLSREETTRSQTHDPSRGAGDQPLYKPATSVTVTSDDTGWKNRGGIAGGEPALTPHGWVKAAMAANPTMKSATVGGKPMSVVSFMMEGKYKVEGYVDEQNLLEKVTMWMADPLLGDIPVETTYSDYRDFKGVKFPMRIVRKQNGTPVLELNVTDFWPNAPVGIQPPAAPRPLHIEAKKIADGVWFLDGPSANPVAIEFKNYVAIVETSTSEEYVLAVIKKVKELVPNKPILYDINSHYHTDHAYGLRTYVAEGATIITSEQNKWFYEDVVLKAPHKLQPDLLAKNPKAAKFIWVKDKYVLTDGDRSLEVYWAKDTAHCASQLISYMPKEKLLIETDLLSGPGNKTLPPPGFVNPYIADLGNTIKRLNLDVQQIAIAHSHGVLPVDWLNKQLVGTVQDAPIQPLY